MERCLTVPLPELKSKIPVLPKLEASCNTEEWELVAKNGFYSTGWLKMRTDYNTERRRNRRRPASCLRCHLIRTQSLSNNSPTQTCLFCPVAGKVELLFRTVRQQFYRETAGTKNQLKNKMRGARLEDFESLAIDESGLVNIFSLLLKLGYRPYNVHHEDQVYHLLKGLPA